MKSDYSLMFDVYYIIKLTIILMSREAEIKRNGRNG